jgi:PST family polysaccharide transporter
VFAIALVVYSLLINLNDIGISTTIVRWQGNLDEVAPTATTLIFLTSLIVYGVFFMAAPFCCSLVGASDAAGVTRLLALAIIVDGISAVPTGMLTRYFRQDRRAVADLVNSAVATVIAFMATASGVWRGADFSGISSARSCVCASQSIDIVLVSSSRQQKSSYAAASPYSARRW